MNSILYLLPLFAVIIHNIEEALWLPQWSKYAKKYQKEIKPYEFHFAVLIITALALLVTCGILFFPENFLAESLYFGFFGMMILNAFFPHLILTIVLKKYAPGTITAIILNVPIISCVVIKALYCNIINPLQFVISILIIGVLTLLSLPLLFKLSKIVKEYITN